MEIIIRASQGLWLTDGKNYGKTISLANGASVDDYHEITDAEYEQILEKEAEENDMIGGE